MSAEISRVVLAIATLPPAQRLHLAARVLADGRRDLALAIAEHVVTELRTAGPRAVVDLELDDFDASFRITGNKVLA